MIEICLSILQNALKNLDYISLNMRLLIQMYICANSRHDPLSLSSLRFHVTTQKTNALKLVCIYSHLLAQMLCNFLSYSERRKLW